MKGTCVPFTLRNGGAPAGAQTPRRFTNGTADVNDTVVGLTTDRGYTEHEMLDELGIIHMNGRVYDPYIGRFMSADPYIQAPYELQSHNRYAYVMNNPLLYTDPSGYWSWRSVIKFVVVAIAVVYTAGAASSWLLSGLAGTGGTAFATYSAFGAAQLTTLGAMTVGAAAGFVGGFLGTALNGGNFEQSVKAGVIGGVTGAAFAFVGQAFTAGSWQNYLGHAVIGCGSSVASGGGIEGCARGAASALIGKAVTNNTSGDNWNDFSRGVAATVTGGVTSRVMGGSFASGAQTAAYGYLFNHLSDHNKRSSPFFSGVKDGVTSYADGLAEVASHRMALSGAFGETAMQQAQGYANTVSDAIDWAAQNPKTVAQGVYVLTSNMSAEETRYIQAKIGARVAFGSLISVGTYGVGAVLVPTAAYGNMLEAAKKGASHSEIIKRGGIGY